jgi:hypothetical protein
MAVRIQVRRDSSINWTSNNPILQVGEFGFDTTVNRFKVGIASDNTSRWNALPYLNVIPSELAELAQDAVEAAITAGTGIAKIYNDNANTITLSVDNTIANKTYVDTAISGLGNTVSTGYIPLSLKGNVDGVAELDQNGYVPQTQLTNTLNDITDYVDGAVAGIVNSAPAALNTLKELSDALGADANFATTTATALATKITATSQDTLKNKTISISNGITSVSQYDTTTGFYGQNNIPVIQNGGSGAAINISGTGVITVASSGIGYTSGIAIIGGGTRILIEIDGNTLTGTKAQFNAAMTDADFVTINGAETLTNKTLNSPNINQPYGLVKGDIGLSNVDNTSDANKPVSTAAKSYIDLISYATSSSATTYTLSNSNSAKLTEFTSDSSITLTIPSDPGDTVWPIGTSCEIRQMGLGRIQFQATSPATLVSTDSYVKTRTKYSSVVLEKRAANSWILVGDIDA